MRVLEHTTCRNGYSIHNKKQGRPFRPPLLGADYYSHSIIDAPGTSLGQNSRIRLPADTGRRFELNLNSFLRNYICWKSCGTCGTLGVFRIKRPGRWAICRVPQRIFLRHSCGTCGTLAALCDCSLGYVITLAHPVWHRAAISWVAGNQARPDTLPGQASGSAGPGNLSPAATGLERVEPGPRAPTFGV